MNLPSNTGRKAHVARVRNVVDFASEVRLDLCDAKVVVGSIVFSKEPSVEQFEIRPWGLAKAIVVRFDHVVHAAPVRRMVWAEQRRISSAQMAGVFVGSTRSGGHRSGAGLSADED